MKNLIITATLTGLLFSCNKTEEMNPCTYLDDVDKDMLVLIEQIREKHSSDGIFLKKFQMEQTAWNQYRIRRIKAMYPKDSDKHYVKKYGQEFFNECKCKESARLTEYRIIDLELYLQGPSDQSDCPSIQQEID